VLLDPTARLGQRRFVVTLERLSGICSAFGMGRQGKVTGRHLLGDALSGDRLDHHPQILDR
jgi:hypothetical protein